MKEIYLVIIIVLTLFSGQNLYGQDAKEEHFEEHPRHRIVIIMSHAHVPNGIKGEEDKKWLVLAGWGFDYDFYFNPKWAMGLHSDFIIENFELEEHFGETREVIQRSKPFSSAVMVTYKPVDHWSFMVGGGAEFSKEETLALLRVGLEYGWELPDHWELGLSLMNDFKINSYNSWVLGLGVSKFL